MQKFCTLLTIVCVLSFSFSCTNVGSDHGSISGLSRNSTSVDSIYISDIDSLSTRNNRASMDSVARFSSNVEGSIISFIDGYGRECPLTFDTTTNLQVTVNATDLFRISNSHIVISFNATMKYLENENHIVDRVEISDRKMIVDVVNGTTYDISAYDLENAIIDGDTIYLLDRDNSTVYKMNLLSRIASPLNNGSINPVTKILFLTNNQKLITEGIGGSFSGTHYVLDTNMVLTPRVLSHVNVYTNGVWKTINVARYKDQIIQDDSGDLWLYDITSFTSPGNNNFVTLKISFDDDGNTIASDIVEGDLAFIPSPYLGFSGSLCHLWSGRPLTFNGLSENVFRKRSRTHLWANGFVTVDVDPSGNGLQIDSSAVTLPYISSGTRCPYLNGTKLYHIYETQIYETDLTTGTSSIIFEDSNILNPAVITEWGNPVYVTISVSGSVMYFYMYSSPTDIDTYSMDLDPLSIPELVNINMTNTRYVTEFEIP